MEPNVTKPNLITILNQRKKNTSEHLQHEEKTMTRIFTTFTALIAVAAMLAVAGGATAATIHGPIESDSADNRVNDADGDLVGNTAHNSGELSMRVGGFNENTTTGAVMPFELPEMGPGELIVTDASLQFRHFSRKNEDLFQQGDLYVADVRSTAVVLAGDFDTTHTLLQAAVIPDSDTGNGTTRTSDAGASTALSNWLNTGNRYQAGEFLFLAILPSNVHDDDSGWDVGSANRDNSAESPQLTLTTAIPEPTSLALLGLGGLALLRRRQ